MSVIIELVKIFLLGCIAIFMGMSIEVLPMPFQEKVDKDRHSSGMEIGGELKEDKKERAGDLRTIMEQSVAQLFRFPESIQFQSTNYRYTRVFQDNGINLPDEQEREYAVICGKYAVQNAVAVYSPFRRFYAEVSVNNEEKSIDGEVWLDIDGKIKKLLQLESKTMLDGDEGEFEKLFTMSCRGSEDTFMGVFQDYKEEVSLGSTRGYLKIFQKLSTYPEAKKSLSNCFSSGASRDYCIGAEMCQRIKEFDEDEAVWAESCDFFYEVCSADDSPVVCEKKLQAADIARKSSND